MVQWTYENAKRCTRMDDVIVATDSPEIAHIIHAVGGQVAMTDPNLANGSTRVAAVAATRPDADIIVNLQGDEPFIQPHMLEALVAPYLAGEKPVMTTLAYTLAKEHHQNPNIVKVITDLHGNALYFSRAPIPYFRTTQTVPVYHHMGLYAYTREFIQHYTTLPETPLEKAECLEQLRVLEHGYDIRVCLTRAKTLEVNTEAEYLAAQEFVYELS